MKGLGYDMVILDEGATGRPDPFTGQVPIGIDPAPATSGRSSTTPAATQQFLARYPEAPTQAPAYVELHFFVFSFENPDPDSEHFPPAIVEPTAQVRLALCRQGRRRPWSTTSSPPRLPRAHEILATDNKFFWLYLRRPANPDLPIQEDPALADYNPAVVVDSIRFPYTDSGRHRHRRRMSGVDIVNGPHPDELLLHPAVCSPTGAARPCPPCPCRQWAPRPSPRPPLRPLAADDHDRSEHHDVVPRLPQLRRERALRLVHHGYSVLPILPLASHHRPDRLLPRSDNSYGGTNVDAQWDFFPFHDRDFQSVAELLLVPGCPPGLFTKRFVEFAARQR